jgi:hypothetical protein
MELTGGDPVATASPDELTNGRGGALQRESLGLQTGHHLHLPGIEPFQGPLTDLELVGIRRLTAVLTDP